MAVSASVSAKEFGTCVRVVMAETLVQNTKPSVFLNDLGLWHSNGNLLTGHVVIWVLAGMDEMLVVARAEC